MVQLAPEGLPGPSLYLLSSGEKQNDTNRLYSMHSILNGIHGKNLLNRQNWGLPLRIMYLAKKSIPG